MSYGTWNQLLSVFVYSFIIVIRVNGIASSTDNWTRHLKFNNTPEEERTLCMSDIGTNRIELNESIRSGMAPEDSRYQQQCLQVCIFLLGFIPL